MAHCNKKITFDKVPQQLIDQGIVDGIFATCYNSILYLKERKNMKQILLPTWSVFLCILISLTLLTSSGADGGNSNMFSPADVQHPDTSHSLAESQTRQEADALEEALTPATSILLKPEASGTHTQSNDYAIVDYSHSDEGYVMVQFTAPTSQRLKTQVVGPSTTYTYNMKQGNWEVFPLSDGNGIYQINVCENVEASRYALVLSAQLTVDLADEFAPFIRPNQYVNYENAELTMDTAARLTNGHHELLAKVEVIYDYVLENITYDTDKAATVKSGYLPDLDAVLEAGTGICFDYASLMTGMLRSQGIPCKLVVGYAGEVYHAWISVWSEETGWVDGAVFFDGTTWQRMDPTFAAGGGNDSSIQEFIGDGTNYTTKYIY